MYSESVSSLISPLIFSEEQDWPESKLDQNQGSSWNRRVRGLSWLGLGLLYLF